MRVLLSIFTEECIREYYLPVIDNTDYSLNIQSSEFGMTDNLNIRMEIIEGSWSFVRTNDYLIISEGLDCFGKPFYKDMMFQIITSEGKVLFGQVAFLAEELIAYRKYYVENKEIYVGRDVENNNIVLNSPNASRRHMVLSFTKGKIYIEDFSKTGTYVNGKRIKPNLKTDVGPCARIHCANVTIVCLSNIIAISAIDKDAFTVDAKMVEIKSNQFNEQGRGALSTLYDEIVHISPRKPPIMHSGEEVFEKVPAKKEEDKKPAWMNILPSLTMMLPMVLGYSMMNTGNMSMGLTICVGSAIVGTAWSIINLRYARKTVREEEMYRLKRYEQYLVQKSDYIRTMFEENKKALLDYYPNAQICSEYTSNSPELWTRRSVHSDFLFVRLGLGTMPFQVHIKAPKNEFSMNDDELSERAIKIAESFKELHDVPLGVSLKDNSIVGIVYGDNEERGQDIKRLLLTQIAASHSYTDVKFCILEKRKESINSENKYARWYPHVWNEDHTVRYYASDEKNVEDVIYELTKILRIRTECLNEYSSQKKAQLPHYILFIENPEYIEAKPIAKYLLNMGKELGVTTIFFAKTYEQLPSSCEFIIQNDDEFSGIFAVREEGENGTSIKFDQLSEKHASELARRLSAMKVNQVETTNEIPASLSFFDMMKISNVEELAVEERWRKNRTYETMAALLGQKAGGRECYLDINEKYHGPHGLIAGTTGSGKSETLQTYILSLAVNFSPLDVGLFIIDFKGGGMGNLFADLPHTLGVISNLSGNQVHRAMVSISSEIRRRQTLLGNHGVNHIDGYTKLVKNHEATIPMPHLLIIIDEFAELKRDEPEFMKKLISVAQVGRSLGIHLILATQKPSGTVDDNIWSNTKFKLCLRVADKQDSNDMLHRPDAAYLTQAGRCYMQVGNNEIFELFQSGWSGAVFEDGVSDSGKSAAILIDEQGHEADFGRKIKSERKKDATEEWMSEVISAIYQSFDCCELQAKDLGQNEKAEIAERTIAILNEVEFRYPNNKNNIRKLESIIEYCDEARRQDIQLLARKIINEFMLVGRKLPEPLEKTQLDVVRDYLVKVVKECSMENSQLLWMPLLPERLNLEQMKEYQEGAFTGVGWRKHDEVTLDTVLGFVDDPENQMQYPLKINLLKKGHLIVAGNVTSGKSTFVQTLVYGLISTYSPNEVNVYGVDFSSQMLTAFEQDVHVGGIVVEGENDRLKKLFGMLMDILQKRKSIIRGGNFSQYIQKNGKILPAIVLIIDGYGNFREKTNDDYENVLLELSRSAENYGIYLVITCTNIGSTELQQKIADNMRQGICLEMGDKYAYGSILGVSHSDILPEENVKGRGLAIIDGAILEYQTAIVGEVENDYARLEAIRQRSQFMSRKWMGLSARRIPEIPEKPTWNDFSKMSTYQEMIKETDFLPVAYYQENASLYGIDLSKTFCYLILGKTRSGKTTMLRNIACAAKDKGGVIMFFDSPKNTDLRTAEFVGAQYISNSEEYKNAVIQLIQYTNQRGMRRKELLNLGLNDEEVYRTIATEFEAVYVLISDFYEFQKEIYNENSGVKLNQRIENIIEKGRLLNVHFFAVADIEQLGMVADKITFINYTKEKMGVLLGGELSKQLIFEYQNVNYRETGKKLKMGYAYAVNCEDNSKVDLIVFPENRGALGL